MILSESENQQAKLEKMQQSDFYRKKSFNNPEKFIQTATINNEEKSVTPVPGAEPAPVASRTETPKITAADENNTKAVTSTTNEQDDLRTEHLFKHPLQNAWSLWYFEQDRSKEWRANQKIITTFDTVEDFWSLYNHIKPPSEIKSGNDYSLFKEGIQPMWEDSRNSNGGTFIITFNKNLKFDLDNLWLDCLLCLIGEGFDHSDDICGATVNVRKSNSRINVWTSNYKNVEAITEIGQKLKEALHLPRQTMNYCMNTHIMKRIVPLKPLYTF